jgi:hypothetical protein
MTFSTVRRHPGPWQSRSEKRKCALVSFYAAKGSVRDCKSPPNPVVTKFRAFILKFLCNLILLLILSALRSSSLNFEEALL